MPKERCFDVRNLQHPSLKVRTLPFLFFLSFFLSFSLSFFLSFFLFFLSFFLSPPHFFHSRLFLLFFLSAHEQHPVCKWGPVFFFSSGSRFTKGYDYGTIDINRSSMANCVLRKSAINRKPLWNGALVSPLSLSQEIGSQCPGCSKIVFIGEMRK